MPPDRRGDRQSALRRALEADGLEALLVTHLPNIRYLTGFSGSAALLLVRHDATTLITDFRYAVQAPNEAGASATVEVDQKSVWDRLARVVAAAHTRSLGIEALRDHVRDAERSVRSLGAVWCRRPSWSSAPRHQSPEEVAAIRARPSWPSAALAEVLPTVAWGKASVRRRRARRALRRRGSEWHPFSDHCRERSAGGAAHARTSGRPVEHGEWLRLDFGAQVDGYCADLTRTVIVGARADERQRTIYELVHAAQRRALDHLRAQTGREGDALARGRHRRRGFGEAFGHSLGHGLGLEVPRPRARPDGRRAAALHAVVTVEPGSTSGLGRGPAGGRRAPAP